MKKCGVTFQILHYGDYRLTVKCIRCLFDLDKMEYCRIVVIDNGTYSKEKVVTELGRHRFDVTYLELENNVGFSKGNNYGWRLCREDSTQDFIVVLNNDVFIYQKNFISLLYNLYKEQKFYVAGPDVFCRRKRIHTNPMSLKLFDDKMALEYINSHSSLFREYLKELGWPYLLYKNTFGRLKGRNPSIYKSRHENALLHGCCLIFSLEFIQLNEKVFVPETFLYAEENYLQWRCYKNGWKTLYLPELVVEHYDSGSSKTKVLSYYSFKQKKKKQDAQKRLALLQYIKYLQEEMDE